MDEDLIFRIIVIAFVSTAQKISIYYRRKAQQSSGEQIDRHQEGDFIMYALRIGGGLIWLTILAYIFYPQRISWALFHLPSWMRWLGVLGGFAALLLLFWMFRSLGMNITDTVVTRNKHSLVTKRPYRWIRHPLYTFGGLVLLCLSLITTIWLIPMLAIPTFAILIRRTSIEEQALLERFGDEYRLYSESTGRFFPNIGIQTINSNRPDQILIITRCLRFSFRKPVSFSFKQLLPIILYMGVAVIISIRFNAFEHLNGRKYPGGTQWKSLELTLEDRELKVPLLTPTRVNCSPIATD